MFDRYVAQTRPSWKRRALIIASLIAHAIAGVGLGIWSIFHVEEIAPPVLSLTFFSAPPPPPPPPPPKKKSSAATEKKPDTTIQKTVQPDLNKLTQPKLDEKKPEAKEDGEDDGKDDGVKEGQKDGVSGSNGPPGGSGNGPPQAKAPPTVAPRTVAGFTLIAQQLAHPNPHLPDAVMAARPHQDVKGMYKVCIKNDGHISDVYVMTGIPGADDQLAAQIKSTWIYKPQPVPICFVAALTFKVP